MKKKSVYINTIGCQMNVYDTEQIIRALSVIGYRPVSVMEKADLIIVNTCAIREKAEQKAFSFLGRLAAMKRKNPGLIVGIGGCVAQQEGRKIFKRMPHVDLVFGTRAIGRLHHIIQQIESKKCRIVDIEIENDRCDFISLNDINDNADLGSKSKFVTIMQGCDNFCTYCVVPYVRGREISRKPEDIINEIGRFVDSGVREVTLLGQNVNSYGKKEGLCSFPELLSHVNDIEGLSRIRFTTSHPKDLSEELIFAFKYLNKLCNHIHLPVQSGSNKILKKMNRKYTRELYIENIEKLRHNCIDIAVTSDIIVGFPGETESDFEDTISLVNDVKFDGLFAFIYSDRPNAPAAGFLNKVPEKEKKERLQRLLDLQKIYTDKNNRALTGSVEQVLVEGLSKMQCIGKSKKADGAQEWTGRTSTNRIVNFIEPAFCNSGKESMLIAAGKMVDVKIEKAMAHSVWGKAVKTESELTGSKGVKSYAA